MKKENPSGNRKFDRVRQILSLLTCFLLLFAVSVNRDAKIFGRELQTPEAEVQGPVRQSADGAVVINTSTLASDITGYGGTTPVEITLRDGRVAGVTPLRNAESPEFFGKLQDARMFDAWNGKTPEEALKVQVDGITGATLSSRSVVATVRRGLEYAAKVPASGASSAAPAFWTSPKTLCALVVVLTGTFLPLFFRSRRYRVVQLVLNVIVLGLWCGTFLSYSLLVSYISNGVNPLTATVGVVMLLAAFVLPLFGKKNHYCNWVCPFGSLQELAGKTVRRKWTLTPVVVKWLNRFRDMLWCILMLVMWTGIGFSWMDYEVFTAFMFREAAPAVVALAVLVVALSCFVPRPYCRFVCPTGVLLRMSQQNK